jgi:hypothetical protein
MFARPEMATCRHLSAMTWSCPCGSAEEGEISAQSLKSADI